MKVLLVGINSKYIHPAMGIMQLAANTSWPVTIWEYTIKDDVNRVVNDILSYHADVVGISVYIWNASFVQKVISLLPSSLMIVLGGPEASYRYLDYFSYPNVAYITKNEGERAFHLLLDYLNGQLSKSSVPNLYYREQGINYTFDLNSDTSFIKHDYDLMGDPKNRYVYLESSRGCPYSCSYCLASLDKKVRFFPIEQIKAEILWALKAQAKTVKFLDRTFNVDSKRMLEILSFIKANDNQTTVFQMEIVADILTPEVVLFLKQIRLGLIRFEIGIQSTNEATTKAVFRKQLFSKIKALIDDIKDHVIVHLDLIAGLPYEDKTSFQKTFNETLLIFPDELQLGILKALAGTRIVNEKLLHEYAFNDDPPYEIISNKYLSKCDLEEIKLVEEGLNRYYNSHRFMKTLKHLLQDLQWDGYQLFLTFGTYLKENPQSRLQIKDLAKALASALKLSSFDYLMFLLKQDYLDQAVLKPSVWWEYQIEKPEKYLVFSLFMKEYPILSTVNLARNSRLEKWESDAKTEYYLVLYQPKQSYALSIKKD